MCAPAFISEHDSDPLPFSATALACSDYCPDRWRSCWRESGTDSRVFRTSAPLQIGNIRVCDLEFSQAIPLTVLTIMALVLLGVVATDRCKNGSCRPRF